MHGSEGTREVAREEAEGEGARVESQDHQSRSQPSTRERRADIEIKAAPRKDRGRIQLASWVQVPQARNEARYEACLPPEPEGAAKSEFGAMSGSQVAVRALPTSGP